MPPVQNVFDLSGRADMYNDTVQIEDLLFSRTDNRGVIQSANSVFQHISGYDWSELSGAPHKLVRHPDMPKGVFHLMWQTIQAGQPVGAYVCNLAKSGGAYWVFATVLPVDGGYVSLRIKPSCGYLDQLAPIYQSVRQRENEGELSPEQSADEIGRAVAGLDFADYSEFYCFALLEEILSRDALMGHGAEQQLAHFRDMFRGSRALEHRAKQIERTFRDTHQIPHNMRLQASRLEGVDGPISVISANHRLMTQGLEERLLRFGEDSSVGGEAIRLALFKSAVRRLVHEVGTALNAETGREGAGLQDDKRVLCDLSESYAAQSLTAVQDLTTRVNTFGKTCRDMQRMMAGLELTRMMCKIERAKVEGDQGGLDEIINRLAQAQKSLTQNFEEILSLVTRIIDLGDNVRRHT